MPRGLNFFGKIPKIFSRSVMVFLGVFLLFVCFFSFNSLSLHVLLVGDWPHDALSPVYGESWVQVGWAQSLGRLPADKLENFDVVIVDDSVKDYIKKPPYSLIFDEYANSGTLVIIEGKTLKVGGVILNETVVGGGRVIEVASSISPSFGSSEWASLKSFWDGVFVNAAGSLRVALLCLTVVGFAVAIVVLSLCFIAQVLMKFMGLRKRARV